MRLGTRRISRLLQRADTIGGPVWDPHGQRLVFSSNVMAGDIWEVSFRDPDRLEKVLVGHDAFDLAFSPTGVLLGAERNRPYSLVTIDTATGHITDLGPTVNLLDGIAFAPTAVPEPASMALLGCGLVALAWRRRRC